MKKKDSRIKQIKLRKIFLQHAQLTFHNTFAKLPSRRLLYLIIVLICGFNHVVLSRSPTSEIIVLIFRHDIIVIHYRPRYTAVKPRDISQPEGKRVSECLRVTRRLPHNTNPCPLKFNCEFDSIFTRQVSASSARSGSTLKIRHALWEIIQKCHAIESQPRVIFFPFLPVITLIHTV